VARQRTHTKAGKGIPRKKGLMAYIKEEHLSRKRKGERGEKATTSPGEFGGDYPFTYGKKWLREPRRNVPLRGTGREAAKRKKNPGEGEFLRHPPETAGNIGGGEKHFGGK